MALAAATPLRPGGEDRARPALDHGHAARSPCPGRGECCAHTILRPRAHCARSAAAGQTTAHSASLKLPGPPPCFPQHPDTVGGLSVDRRRAALRRDFHGHLGGLCWADPSATLNGRAMSSASRNHRLKRHRCSPRRHL
ncbi:hypothetical protein G6F31_019372 [Rhizopus arrhizus]|nr:hypothetical protein G6F31_019372 [Rhizopus arrhizus]